MGSLFPRSASDGEESAALLGNSICKAECGLYTRQSGIRNLLLRSSQRPADFLSLSSPGLSLTHETCC